MHLVNNSATLLLSTKQLDTAATAAFLVLWKKEEQCYYLLPQKLHPNSSSITLCCYHACLVLFIPIIYLRRQAFISEFPVWNWSSLFPSWRPLDILFTRQHFVALYDVQVLLVLKEEEKEEEAKKKNNYNGLFHMQQALPSNLGCCWFDFRWHGRRSEALIRHFSAKRTFTTILDEKGRKKGEKRENENYTFFYVCWRRQPMNTTFTTTTSTLAVIFIIPKVK